MLLALSVSATGQTRPVVESAPLRPGDRVILDNPVDPIRREFFDVDETGLLSLPRIGRLDVSKIPATAVGDSVRGRYGRFQRVDDVYVQAQRRVTLVGEVRRPGVFYFSLFVTVRDAISEAGGVTENGRDCCIALLRGTGSAAIVDWQTRAAADLLLASGDILVIPREPWVKRNILALISGVAVLLSSLVLATR